MKKSKNWKIVLNKKVKMAERVNNVFIFNYHASEN